MDFFTWSMIILGVWAALGPLVGVRYGQGLSHRYQKERWIADSQKKEWKELLEAIDEAFRWFMEVASNSTRGPDTREAVARARLNVSLVFRDRIFIAEEVSKSLLEQFMKVTERIDWEVNVEKIKIHMRK